MLGKDFEGYSFAKGIQKFVMIFVISKFIFLPRENYERFDIGIINNYFGIPLRRLHFSMLFLVLQNYIDYSYFSTIFYIYDSTKQNTN